MGCRDVGCRVHCRWNLVNMIIQTIVLSHGTSCLAVFFKMKFGILYLFLKLRFSWEFERISSALRLIFNLVTLKNVGKFSGPLCKTAGNDDHSLRKKKKSFRQLVTCTFYLNFHICGLLLILYFLEFIYKVSFNHLVI